MSNFVLDGDGLHFIDREWRAQAGVGAYLVMARALWLLAVQIIRSGSAHPWPDETTVDQLAATLGELCELDVGGRILDRVTAAEVELQHVVTGRDRETLATDLRWLRDRSRINSAVAGTLPFTRLEGRIDDLQSQLLDLLKRHRELAETAHDREHELRHELAEASLAADRLRGDLGVATEHLEGTRSELEAHRRELASAGEELDMWRDRQLRFERRLPVRLLRSVQRLLGR